MTHERTPTTDIQRNTRDDNVAVSRSDKETKKVANDDRIHASIASVELLQELVGGLQMLRIARLVLAQVVIGVDELRHPELGLADVLSLIWVGFGEDECKLVRQVM